MASVSFVPQVSSVGGSTTVAAKSQAPGQEAATLSKDSVKLSVAAQVKMMHHQGLSPSTISAQVGIPVSQVNSYLPGSTTAATSIPAAPQATPSESDSAPAAGPKASATTAPATPAPASALKAGA